jgi:hypothetical protein
LSARDGSLAVTRRSARATSSFDESGYCITSVACKAAHFRPDAGVEIESDAHLLAIDTKMAFQRACFSALVKVTDMEALGVKHYHTVLFTFFTFFIQILCST